jgi:hypothetical protein
LQTDKDELEEKIIQKLENACIFREQQIEKMKEKLREHVNYWSLV